MAQSVSEVPDTQSLTWMPSTYMIIQVWYMPIIAALTEKETGRCWEHTGHLICTIKISMLSERCCPKNNIESNRVKHLPSTSDLFKHAHICEDTHM